RAQSERGTAPLSPQRALLLPFPPPAARRSLFPVIPLAEPGDADPGVGLVADVDRDQEGRELLRDPRRLERASVHRAKARDQLDDPRDPRLVHLAVAADEDVLV